jgi:hypothetical protein
MAAQGRDGINRLLELLTDKASNNVLPRSMREALQVIVAQLAHLQEQIGSEAELDRREGTTWRHIKTG